MMSRALLYGFIGAMTDITVASTTAPPAASRSRWRRWLIGALAILVGGALANLLGWDIAGWFSDLWDVISSISVAYLVAAAVLKTLQTSAVAFAYFAILRFAYPGKVRFLEVLAAYAASVALNNILPANIGTFVLLVMFTLIIPEATFAGVLAVYGVQKIFFVAIGAFPYLYLFLSVGGSFEIKFEWVKAHPWGTVVMFAGGGLLLFLVGQMLWPRVLMWWDKAKEGGRILASPRKYLLQVLLPEGVSWIASLGVIAVFLAAYSIPVTFHTLMRIVAGNSIANVTSVTPGGVGVNQAFNVASLSGIASPADATAYSVAQQLFTTAWNILFAIVLMAWAFGWSGGKQLMGESYREAKEKEAERKAARAAKQAERAAASAAEADPSAARE
jgi:uncharacterized membrane protein YbhN (UPF0104 family)